MMGSSRMIASNSSCTSFLHLHSLSENYMLDIFTIVERRGFLQNNITSYWKGDAPQRVTVHIEMHGCHFFQIVVKFHILHQALHALNA